MGVHHAGLTLDDRRMTEDLFLKKIIQIVVATSVSIPPSLRIFDQSDSAHYADISGRCKLT